MAEQNDYQGGNYIVDYLIEEEQQTRTNMEAAAKRADRMLSTIGCSTRSQAALLVSELQREEDLWLRLRTSRVGLPTLFSMGAMMVSILAFFIASGLSPEDPLAALLALGIAALLLIVLSYWILEFRRFNKAARSGDISVICELHRSLNAWLLLNNGVENELRPEKLHDSEHSDKTMCNQKPNDSNHASTAPASKNLTNPATNGSHTHIVMDEERALDGQASPCEATRNRETDALLAIMRGREDELAGRTRSLDDARADARETREAHQQENRTSE